MKKPIFFITILLLLTALLTLIPQKPKRTKYPFSPNAEPSAPLTAQEAKIPVFDHIIVIIFENQDYQSIIGVDQMPTFNHLANQNVLLTNYYGVAHPSLPNYLALMGGDTFGITKNCKYCFINDTSLPDLIEASGRSWKTYQEDLPTPCFIGSTVNYKQRHNPFIYFDPIRNNPERCKRSVVSLDALDADLAANNLPNFAFITPNICNSSHDCTLDVTDEWLGKVIPKLQGSSALGQNYLIFIGFEEGSLDQSSCCGLPHPGGGRVAAMLISPQAKSGFQDSTPLSHYSLLKTILISWNLPALGYSADPETQAITAPWN